MIDTKKYIYIEGIPPFIYVRFMSDLEDKFTMVKVENLFNALKTEFHIRHSIIDDIHVKLKSGMNLLLDIQTHDVYRCDDFDQIVINSQVIRKPQTSKQEHQLPIFNSSIEAYVNKTLRK